MSENYLCLTTKKRPLSEWEDIFRMWSNIMDLLYDEKERDDATEWHPGSNPADWMEVYDDGVFESWNEHDCDGIEWKKKLEEWLK